MAVEVGGGHAYPVDAVEVVRLAAAFGKFGVEPRHLRTFRHAAEREAGLYSQVVTPLLYQRNPEARPCVTELKSSSSWAPRSTRRSCGRRSTTSAGDEKRAGGDALSADEIAAIIVRLAGEIDADHPDGVEIVGLLKGGVFLVADLVRALTVRCTVDFLALSSYVAGERRVRILKDLDQDVTGRDVVVAADVVDTGLSTA